MSERFRKPFLIHDYLFSNGTLGTILPSGPVAAIASFGTPQGHNLSLGPSSSWAAETRQFMDALLRTDFVRTLWGDHESFADDRED